MANNSDIKIKYQKDTIINGSIKDGSIVLNGFRQDYSQIIYNNNDPIGIEFELTAWDTGKFTTPNFSFDIMKNNEVNYSFQLEPIDFEIVSILTTIDQAEFKDIKGPIPVKNIFPFRKILYVFLLLVLMVAIILMWRKRISPEYEKINYDFLEDPYERASRRIKELFIHMLERTNYTIGKIPNSKVKKPGYTPKISESKKQS